MKHILVPCDFSKPAINAFRFALDIAHQGAGTVHLLHVIEFPLLSGDTTLHYEEQMLEELNEKAAQRFRDMTEKYKTKNVKILWDIQRGVVTRTIVESVEKNAIDLVIMGSSGSGGITEFLIGSNAEKMVRHSPAPVLVVKNYQKGRIKNIVFPHDLSEEVHEELMEKVKELQRFFNAKLHLVWINTPLNFTSDTITLPNLQTVARRNHMTNYTLNVFNHGQEEEGILQFANKIGADLIAIGTHGRKGISHLITGSVAEDVVNHSKGLVWTYAVD